MAKETVSPELQAARARAARGPAPSVSQFPQPVVRGSGEKQEFAPTQASAGMFGPPEGWNYKTSPTGMEGQPLPVGAVGWTPQGEAYYGYGKIPIIGNAVEWFKGAWDRIKEATSAELDKQIEANKEAPALSPARLGATASVGLKVVGKELGEGIRGAGEVLNVAAQATEQTIGALEGTHQAGEGSILPDIQTFIQQKVGSYPQNRGFFSDAGNFVVNYVTSLNPYIVSYNAIRMVTAPLSLDEKRDRILDHAEAGRIAYSAWVDPALREDFIRRYNEGQDPYLLQQELQKPGAELVGQLIFDPLNLIGGWMGKAGKAGDVAASGRRAEMLVDISKVGTEADLADTIARHVPNLMADVADRTGKITDLSKKVGLFVPTAGGKRWMVGQRAGDFIQFVLSLNKNDPEAGVALLGDLVQLGSKNEAEVTGALGRILHDRRFAQIWLSDDALDTAAVLRKMLENEDGIVDAERFLKSFAGKNYEDVVKLADSAIDRAVNRVFPTLSERLASIKQVDALRAAGKDVPAHLARWAAEADEIGTPLRTLEVFDRVAQAKVYQPLNRFFAGIYMGLSPGYAVRNLLTNYAHMFVDYGVEVFTKTPATRVTESMRWLGGISPKSMTQALSQTAGAAEGLLNSKVTRLPFAALSNNFERAGGEMVYGLSVEQSMRKMLIPGRALPNLDALINAGMDPKAAGYLAKLVVDNYGDVKAASAAFRAAVGTGSIDAWRTLEWLNPRELKLFQTPIGGGTIFSRITQDLAGITDPTQARKVVDKIISELREQAGRVAKETAGVTRNADGTVRGTAGAIVRFFEDTKGVAPKEAEELLRNIEAGDHLAVQGYQEAVSHLPGGQDIVRQIDDLWNAATRNCDDITKSAVKEWEQIIGAADAAKKTASGSPEAKRLWDLYSEQMLGEFTKARDTAAQMAEAAADEAMRSGVITDPDSMLKVARKALLDAADWHGAVRENGKWVFREGTAEARKLIPPFTGSPSPARTIHELLPVLEERLGQLATDIESRAGQTVKVFEDENIAKAVDDWARVAEGQVAEARFMSKKVADAARKFTLLSYPEKMGLDLLTGYVFPYQFWYSRTYMNWMTRLVNNPAILSHYTQYRRTLENIHVGAPDWWKYTINTNELLGLDSESPLFFNLEATLNPLNGVTGVDFNDSEKRKGWFACLLDDMGKFGPSVWTPYSTAVAIALYAKGDTEAAARWGGRLFPQTASIKSLIGLLHHKVSDVPLQGEYDPFVWLFSGGLDPYERRRVGRALGMLVDEKQISPEAAVDAAHSQQGDIWNAALDRAVNQRAPGQLASFLLGVGFKARSQSDMEIDKFYSDWGRLWTLSDNISPDELKRGMDSLRTRYPFMDAVLVSRKGGIERDRAFAYTVLGRIPPSMSGDFAEWAGIPSELMSKFYDSKGDISSWGESDRQRFMSGVLDIAAMVAAPKEATRKEWTEVKNRYSDITGVAEALYGKDIWDRVDAWYAVRDGTDKGYDLADAMMRRDPEIQQALDYKQAAIMADPLLFKYYGSLGTIEQYYKGQMYRDIENELGPDIYNLWEEYWNTLPSGRQAFKRAHPELTRYGEIKDEWAPLIEQALLDFGSTIRDIPVDLRTNTAETYGQEQILQGIQNQNAGLPQMSWGEWSSVMGPSLSGLVMDYAQDGQALPKSVMGMLDSLAEEMGLFDGKLMLELAAQAAIMGQ